MTAERNRAKRPHRPDGTLFIDGSEGTAEIPFWAWGDFVEATRDYPGEVPEIALCQDWDERLSAVEADDTHSRLVEMALQHIR